MEIGIGEAFGNDLFNDQPEANMENELPDGDIIGFHA